MNGDGIQASLNEEEIPQYDEFKINELQELRDLEFNYFDNTENLTDVYIDVTTIFIISDLSKLTVNLNYIEIDGSNIGHF